ncbi:hypothetical protein C0991_009342 [Blastosporella zonata]|nr:hypothetical protein C0991_009342 [Blastosporella zonata]
MFHRPAAGGPESSEGLTAPNPALENSLSPRMIFPRRSSTGTVDDTRHWLKPKGSNDSLSSHHLSRSGLLQARSYNQSNGFGSDSSYDGPHRSHSQGTIRESTMELSSISFSSSSPMRNNSPPTTEVLACQPIVASSPPLLAPSRQSSGDATPRPPFQPSGLSLLRHEYETGSKSGSEGSRTPTATPAGSPPESEIVPMPAHRVHWSDAHAKAIPTASSTPVAALVSPPGSPPPVLSETTPLIRRSSVVSLPKRTAAKTALGLTDISHVMEVGFKSIPAVLLGCLLNILDGVSYGMIIFPGTGVFSELGPMGVSMFFLSATLAQTVYTFGGSGFAGANGSMMIEVVPFFHILANEIALHIGESNPKEVIATTLAAHILVGCIGGVGAFLMQTGFTVSMRIGEDDLGADWKTIQMMFLDTHNLTLWVIPLILAVLLRVITYKFHHQLIFPIYFLVIPVIFYVIVAALGLDLWDLRRAGWIFDMGTGESEAWYKFYSYLDFGSIRFGALWATMPTQFALLFFNILHPPLNVPALSVSLDEDIDTNKELVSHGYSNLLSGLFGTV